MTASVDSAQVSAGDEIPSLTLELTLSRVVLTPAANRDFFPGHHLESYARDEQGLETCYANTMTLQGFIDRTVLSWAGPDWYVLRRTMSILRQAYAGYDLVGEGTVLGTGKLADGLPFVRVAVELRCGAVTAARAVVIIVAATAVPRAVIEQSGLDGESS